MVSDGGGRFISTYIVGVHTLSLLLSSRVAHDRAIGNYIQEEGRQELYGTTTERLVGTVHKPR